MLFRKIKFFVHDDETQGQTEWAMILLGLPWHFDALGAPKLFGFNAKQFRWCFDRYMH